MNSTIVDVWCSRPASRPFLRRVPEAFRFSVVHSMRVTLLPLRLIPGPRDMRRAVLLTGESRRDTRENAGHSRWRSHPVRTRRPAFSGADLMASRERASRASGFSPCTLSPAFGARGSSDALPGRFAGILESRRECPTEARLDHEPFSGGPAASRPRSLRISSCRGSSPVACTTGGGNT